MPGLLDLIAARNPEQARGLLSDLMAGPKLRLSGLLADPVGFANETLQEGLFGSPETRAARDKFWNKESMTEQENQAYTNQLLNLGLAGLTVYHGSPHKFDKFDMSKIGTGEGAQAYGHGLYFAESPGVAKTYQTTLTMDRGFDYGGKSGLTRQEVQDLANKEFGSKYADGVTLPSGVADRVMDDIVYGGTGRLPRTYKPGSERAKIYETIKNNIRHTDEGAFYKVDIPDEAIPKMLDWDKPLSQQSEFVQSIIARKYGVSLDNYRKMMKLDPDKFDKTGKEMVSSYRGAQPDEVTSDLFANGIPGIRYLDGGSRNAGQGTYNYVVFDDALPTILERNGQALK